VFVRVRGKYYSICTDDNKGYFEPPSVEMVGNFKKMPTRKILTAIFSKQTWIGVELERNFVGYKFIRDSNLT